MESFASARGQSGCVNTSTDQEPRPDLVEVALEKLLSSATLQSSPRLRRFLEQVVSHSLTGDDDSLKEYTLGVDVSTAVPGSIRVATRSCESKLADCARNCARTIAPKVRLTW